MSLIFELYNQAKFHYFDGKISKMKSKTYKAHATNSLRRYGYQRPIQSEDLKKKKKSDRTKWLFSLV
jgi:hypothetical protein